MTKQDSRVAFEAWFYASKYAQVVNPSLGDVRRGWDAWQASRTNALLDVIEELAGMTSTSGIARSTINVCIEAIKEL